jgi:hypothetical protein
MQVRLNTWLQLETHIPPVSCTVEFNEDRDVQLLYTDLELFRDQLNLSYLNTLYTSKPEPLSIIRISYIPTKVAKEKNPFYVETIFRDLAELGRDLTTPDRYF